MALNLETDLILTGNGVQSDGYGAKTWSGTAFKFDAGDYDGATFYFEVVAVNSNASTAYSPVLYDQTNGTDRASVSVAASTTTAKRLRSSSFTPASGNVEYRVKLPQTAVASQLKVYVARVVVVQVDATKTVLYRPLMNGAPGGASSYDDSNYALFSYNATGWVSSNLLQVFLRDDSKNADIASGSPWLISGTAMANVGYNPWISLENKTDSYVRVSGADLEFTAAGAGDGQWVYNELAFASGATNWHSGDEYNGVVQYGNSRGYWARAELRVKLESLSKAEVFKCFMNYTYATTGAEYPYHRVLHTAANWESGYTVGLEASGYCNQNLDMASASETAGDSGAGTPISPYINWNVGSPRKRKRVDGLTLTDGDTYIYETQTTTTNQFTCQANLIYGVSRASAGGSYMGLRRGMW